jgi:cytochrome c oxidase subunit 3
VTIAVVFVVALLTFAGWWLVRQGIATRPWLETGFAEGALGRPPRTMPAAKLGLILFIAVVSTLLVLLVSAYSMRMQLADWSPPPRPRLLWLNTAVLVGASFALHRASRAARRSDRDRIAGNLLLAAAASVLFLVGQLLAWRQLASAGYLPANNPADAFFYLITAVHGLHLAGGLVALARTGTKIAGGVPMDRLRLSVELCATYWHFLLVAWLFLFSMLAFSPAFDWLAALCAAPFR